MSRAVDSRLVAAVLLGSSAFILPFLMGGANGRNVSFAVLVAISIYCVLRLRAESDRAVVGSSSLVLLVIGIVYAAGLLDRPAPVFGINLTDEDYQLVAVGMTSLLVGALLVRVFMPIARDIDLTSTQRRLFVSNDRKLIAFAVTAMLVALINYATSGIPIFADDVNGARFAGNYGVFGRLWPIILPALQVVFIVAAVRIMSNKSTKTWGVLGVLSLIFLILSGGRSLFLIPLIAVALIGVDFFKPRLRTIILLSIAGIGVVGGFGYARTLGSSGSQTNVAYLGMRDQDSWIGSLDISVQTGPRVFSAVRDSISHAFMGGNFFWADMLSFINGATVPSDRLVTSLLNRDPNTVGGLPPTLFGGLYIDWGMPGVIVGSIILGFMLEYFRRLSQRLKTMSALVWTYYLSTYILLSVYSYISAKPAIFVVASLCLFCFDRATEDSRENTDDLQVSRLSGRR
jgi:oligosaccharide repeat unit polymerase